MSGTNERLYPRYENWYFAIQNNRLVLLELFVH